MLIMSPFSKYPLPSSPMEALPAGFVAEMDVWIAIAVPAYGNSSLLFMQENRVYIANSNIPFSILDIFIQMDSRILKRLKCAA